MLDDVLDRSIVDRFKAELVRDIPARPIISQFGRDLIVARLFDAPARERKENPAAHVLSAPNPARESREHLGVKVAKQFATTQERYGHPQKIDDAYRVRAFDEMMTDKPPVREYGTRRQERNKRIFEFLRGT